MIYWILTDTHFGHKQMMEYCNRPADFEARILKQVEHKVSKDDILIHLGDFCIGDDIHWHKQFMSVCAGKKWLIRGNHDHKSHSWYHRNGWDFVGSEARMRMFGENIILSHKPIAFQDDRLDYINVHGHHHNTKHHPEDELDYRQRLVFIEHEYTPINLRSIIECS